MLPVHSFQLPPFWINAMLLIYPPLSKPCEPPAGIARLTATLRGHGFACRAVDSNLEGLLFLLKQPVSAEDTWSRRAAKNVDLHLAALRSPALYRHPARYQRAISDLNRILERAGADHAVQLSLGNYQHHQGSALTSSQLLQAAQHPEKNIFYPYFSQRLNALIAEHQPRHIGLSLNFLSQAPTTFAMLGYLKKHYPHIIRLMGGGLITSWMRKKTWRNPFAEVVDQLFDGPAEQQLLDSLHYQGARDYYPPDYRDLPLDDYLSPGRILPYAASSGCYWNQCNFCPERAEGNRYQPIQPQRVITELEALIQHTQPVLLHLLDNALSPALMTAFTRQPPAVPWYGFARINAQLTDPDYCRALKKSGCVLLKLGIESADDQVLAAMEKGVTLEQTSRALKALHQAGIATYVYLLFGTPTETEEKARRTLHFVREHQAAIGFLNLAIFNLPLASPEADSLALSDFYSGDLSLYSDFEHPLGWNRRQIRNFLEREFKRDPAVAAILRRDPPLFTSNHAAFFSATAM